MVEEKINAKILTNNGKRCYGVEWQRKTFHLREEMELSDVGSALTTIRKFDELFDLSRVRTDEDKPLGKWNDGDLEEYFTYRSKYQFPYFKSLIEVEDWRLMDDIKDDLEKWGLKKVSSQQIAGARSGNQRAADSWYGNEPLDERKWNDDKDQNQYRIKPGYLELAKRVFSKVEKKKSGSP